MSSINREHIVRTIKELGILKGDTILLHSALSSIGYVEGGVDSLIDSFMEVIGEEGTLVMPSFSDNISEPFDVIKTPSDVGIITEVFRKREGVLRSLHPTHSVCAIGKHAEYVTRDHNLCPTPCGRNSPFYKIFELKGKIVLLGVDMNRNTMLHAVEEEVNAAYLVDSFIVPAPTFIEDYLGKTFEIKKFPSGHRDFLKLTPLLRSRSLIKEASVGNAAVKVMEVEKLFGYALEILKKDTTYFLCTNLSCNSCVAGKQKVGCQGYESYSLNRCYQDNCEICVI